MNDQFPKLLSKLDVIILSKDRNESLEQVIQFWSQTPCNIFIFHQTSKLLSMSSKFKNINYFPSNYELFDRLNEIPRYLKSQYTVLANDDEIYLPNALSKIIEMLENRNEIGAVGGQVISYTWAGNLLLGQPIYEYLTDYSNLADSEVSRVMKTFQYKNFMDLLSVYRKDIFIKILRDCVNFSNFSTPYMFEVMFSFFASLNAKSLRVNELYWARNWYQKFQSNDSGWNREVKWGKWYTDESFRIEKQVWFDKLSNLLLTEYSNLFNVKNINFIIDDIFRLLLGQTQKSKKYDFSRFDFISPEKKWIIQNKIPLLKSRIVPRFEKSLIELGRKSIFLSKIDQDILYKFIIDQKKLIP